MNDTNQDQQHPQHHPHPLQRRAAHATTNDTSSCSSNSFETTPKLTAKPPPHQPHNHSVGSLDEGEHLVSSTSVESSPPSLASPRNAAKGGDVAAQQLQQPQNQQHHQHNHHHLQYAPTALSSATAAAAVEGGPQTMPITSSASRQNRATHPDEASVERRDSADMVARASKSSGEAASGVANCNRSVSSTVTVEGDAEAGHSGAIGDNHKIILKLPKTRRDENDAHGVPPSGAGGAPLSSRSNSCHSSSSLLSGAALEEDDDEDEDVVAEDTRKVEPLKIHLGTHHPLKAHASSDGGSSSAEDDAATAAPKLKMTIKGAGGAAAAAVSAEGEPHIVPKLTIRAAAGGEEEGSSVVPKLKMTIKIGEGPEAADRTIGPPPPLPKLTIKTSHDGTSESIISSVSPALSTSSSSSLTSSVSSSSAPPPDTNKIPKLTIKTTGGRQDQQHAVIINQAEVAGSHTPPPIPKLTIKTKSVEVEESAGDGPDAVAEKIPKITIKTSDSQASERQASPKFCIKSQERADGGGGGEKPLVPKLTISVANLEASGGAQMSPKQCAPLKVRQVGGGKVESPERVPKLMISRQESPSSNHLHGAEAGADKVVPKLTIKATNAGDHADSKESKFTIKQKDDEKIPKLTIKSIPPPVPSATSEESDDCHSVDSFSPSKATATTNKVVPKLTIKNLSSPQLRMKVVCEEVAQNGKEAEEGPCELRRCSDDMDIDEALQQQHAPQVFNNVAGKFADTNGELEAEGTASQPPNAKVTRVVDTVDLTSSPSPGSSPAHFNYTDADPRIPDELLEASTPSLLMERLQRESSVIQTMGEGALSSSILLNQLIAPGKLPEPPPLQLKPGGAARSNANSLKYPELTERLLANGAVPQLVPSAAVSAANATATGPAERRRPAETVIDSIEILDTPEGSPRSSLDEAPAGTRFDNHHHFQHHHQLDSEQQQEVLRRNNNTMNNAPANHVGGKRGAASLSEVSPKKARRLEDGHTMATLTIFTNETSPTGTGGPKIITTSPTIIRTAAVNEAAAAAVPQDSPKTHRSRKQRHEHLMTVPMDEEEAVDALLAGEAANNGPKDETSSDAAAALTTTQKKRGRPKKGLMAKMAAVSSAADGVGAAEGDETKAKGDAETGVVAAAAAESPPADKGKSRRVQLLRKRLAIDMVDKVDSDLTSAAGIDGAVGDSGNSTETPKRENRPLRQSRRSATPIVRKQYGGETTPAKPGRKRQSAVAAAAAAAAASAPLAPTPSTTSSSSSSNGGAMDNMLLATLNHFGGSNSSISSACSSSSFSSTTVTTTTTAVVAGGGPAQGQIDLTMCSSSSSSSQHSNGTATTTIASGHQLHANSMLPPTTILSSDPLPDVVFRPNDFSAIRGSTMGSGPDSQDEDGSCGFDRMIGENSAGEESSGSACSQPMTPGRGRGRGRGRGANAAGSGRGTPGGGRGSRGGGGGHRLGRGASAVAKAIAMSRPRCIGGLKHTPDPERLKGLFSPSPQVFEEDTRMSADMTPMTPSLQLTDPQTPTKEPPDFLTNDESQSSIISTGSILDPNNIPSMQHGSAIKRPKKKKMEVCVAEEADFTVASIAEYDWPPPKGCCPSKNRDTFMIQEQVAHYLGIKSFKRKYPDLPRRQVDMEERNWLQEKGLVSEKMCDLGITAVWASDILDIMYTDFYDKYEEYKDYIRQKHLRDIESKQKALGLTVSSGRGLQARDRAMLSASNWNAYFNRSRKEERLACLDLQTLTVNVPAPATAATATMVDRSIAESISEAARAESIPEPPTLLKPRQWERPLDVDMNYPVAVVPGQFTAGYRHYTPLELRCFPLNTVLEDPRNLYELLQQEANEHLESAEQAETCSVSGGATTGLRRVPIRRSRRARGAERNKSQTSSSSTEESSSSSSSSGEDSDSDSDSSSSDSSASSSATDSALSEDEAAPSLCGVCHRTQHRNLKDVPELFIKCYTCCRKVHPSCIEMPHRMVGRVRSYNWQCADCKCCIKCKRKQDTNKMLYCEQCDRGFHIYCLGAKAVPDGRWSCSRCCVCMRCGATKPEGLPQLSQQISPNGGAFKQIKHKKVKWINDYRIDHITKLREHCSMLCVPCARAKPVKRILQSPGAATNPSASSPAIAATLASPIASPSLSCPPKVPTVSQAGAAQSLTGDKPQTGILKPQQQPSTMNKSHQMFPPAAPLSAAPSTLASAEKTASGGVVLAAPPPVVA